MNRNVIMCGGPADGCWVVVEGDVRDWECLVPFQLRAAPEPIDPQGPMPERVRYRIQPCMILGHQLWVGMAVEEDMYDNRAIMRAILQRDVAQHLGAYR